MLTLSGFVALNVAGCGGGGGGSQGQIDTIGTATVTFVLRDAAGATVNGTVTLAGKTLSTTNGRVSFSQIKPGTYKVSYNIRGTITTTTIVVGSDRSQTFLAGPGGAGSSRISVSGRIFLNEGADPNTPNCTTFSTGVAAPVLIRVRDVNAAGRPIILTFLKPDQSNLAASSRGLYSIVGIPESGTFLVEVRQAPNSAAVFTGNSAFFTVRNGQAITNLNICANPSNTAPAPTPPGGTPGATVTPTGNETTTPTETASGTETPTATGSASPTATGSASPTATTTETGVPTPTEQPTLTPTFTPTPTATGTTTPTPTPSPTPTVSLTPSPSAPSLPTVGRRSRSRARSHNR
jgi:hypothetical protein